MNIPGTDLETEEPVAEHALDPGGDPPASHEDDDEDGLVETTTIGTQRMVPVSDLIRYRKEAREAKRTNAELTKQVEWAKGVDAKLKELEPTLQAIRQNPKLVDEVQQGTRPSAATTLQPEDDREAQEWAEDYGLITTEGTLDVARARRQLAKLDERAARIAERQNAPIRQHNAQQASVGHRAHAKTVTLKDGTRLATDESIDQAFGMLPPELTADPNVAALLPILAAGIDVVMGRRKGATAIEYDPPVLTEAAAGRNRSQGVTAETKKLLDRMGVTEKDFAKTSERYVPGRALALE